MTDEQVAVFLGFRPHGDEPVDHYMLARAYRSLRALDFARFLEMFKAAGHDVNGEDARGAPSCRSSPSMTRPRNTSPLCSKSVPGRWTPDPNPTQVHSAEGDAVMTRFSRWLGLAALALVLVGCAHSPQQLNVTPSVTTTLSPVARQQPVVVTVRDTRSSPVLGTRGGLYPETSNLTINPQALNHIRQQVEGALRQLGFSVVPEGTPNANSLVVSLSELSYISPKDGVYVTQADIGATFSAEVRS